MGSDAQGMKNGDYVRVQPEGDEFKPTVGRIIQISRDRRSVNVAFDHLPAFLPAEPGVLDPGTGRSVLKATGVTSAGPWQQEETGTPFLIIPAPVPCSCRYYGHKSWRGQLIPTGDNQCALTIRNEPCLLEAQEDPPDESQCFLIKEQRAVEGPSSMQVLTGLRPAHSAI